MGLRGDPYLEWELKKPVMQIVLIKMPPVYFSPPGRVKCAQEILNHFNDSNTTRDPASGLKC